jgi:hypothetical protein
VEQLIFSEEESATYEKNIFLYILILSFAYYDLNSAVKWRELRTVLVKMFVTIIHPDILNGKERVYTFSPSSVLAKYARSLHKTHEYLITVFMRPCEQGTRTKFQ